MTEFNPICESISVTFQCPDCGKEVTSGPLWVPTPNYAAENNEDSISYEDYEVLRTHNIYSPWPEEMNRQITGRIATYNFSPTPLSESNLKEEKAQGQIFVTGNTVIDALHMVVSKLKSDKALADEQINVLKQAGYDVTRLDGGKKLVLITGHRRENFGDGFISMVTAMKDLSEKYPEVDFVYPMHLNPNVRKPIHEVFGEDLTAYKNFFFIEPLQHKN